MAVRVRLFAAVRDAAGCAETVVAPGPLPAVLDELRTRFGERFAATLRLCTVVVDGDAVAAGGGGPSTAAVQVPDGAEVALLPPSSGGAA